MSFVSGDTGSKLEVTCKDDDTGLVMPLTGATVKLKWLDVADALQTKTMTITDAVMASPIISSSPTNSSDCR